jgi:cellulose synthase (UDP-forming)
MISFLSKILLIPVLLALAGSCLANVKQKHNDLDALWNLYNYTYISNGRVISLDEDHITTSEGQSYAMLRSVWSGDRETFDAAWDWTQKHLSRPDNLFSWKWKEVILDKNAATDADTDIALALLLAAERFDEPAYRSQAMYIIDSIWEKEVLELNGRYYLTGGNWAPAEEFPTIHVGYLAPYAYEIFSRVDSRHPWGELISTSYEILEWIYLDQQLPLPPEKIYIDLTDGSYLISKPGQKAAPRFSYDVFPIFWRVATDEQWFKRGKSELRNNMMRFFEHEWKKREKFLDRYTLQGEPGSEFEALPLYATLASLARTNQSEITGALEAKKIQHLWQNALSDKDTPYYLHNWLWFDRALELKRARSFSEFLSFLYPFDVVNFSQHFPIVLLVLFLALVILLKIRSLRFHTVLKFAAIVLGVFLCSRYLLWRYEHSLNFIEPAGPYISIALFAAEIYCFTTVLLLLVQVGVRPLPKSEPAQADRAFNPDVDIFIPIYSESLDILESTLMAAQMMNYQNKKVYVCDDSHRDSVSALAEEYGAFYIKGPKKHAKAGNINHALQQTHGELVLIFDTDHIPVVSFLDETVPLLADDNVGFVQTSHHFYNPDIFQNSLRTSQAVSDEQDFFHHGIQPARDKWGGAFFVGTGALFRRKALEDVGGLLLMSITEDIHTSQHLHAKGWESRYVGKNLAVGLNAENLSSYLLQRTRWMQGCLQVFFKDNPLFMRGLPLRHKLGYFASQYYFFFPIARMIFFLAPLFYLYFHWHPIFADVSTLLAYLIPFLICLPIMSQLLVPGWPRVIWASAYENTVSAALFRGMFDLILPKKLSFKVTPKGISSDVSRFDYRSSKYSIIILAITLVAILKGMAEYHYFQIEKDAYFFNLVWASINLLLLITPLVIAREHPRHPYQNRIRKNLPVRLDAPGFTTSCETFDIDLSGFSIPYDEQIDIPPEVEVRLCGKDELSMTARCSFYDKDERGRKRIGFDFVVPDKSQRQWLLRYVHCDPATWEASMANRSKSNTVMIFHFFNGLLKSLRRPQELRRMQPRDRVLRIREVNISGEARWAVITDQSLFGLGAYVFGRLPASDTVQIETLDELTEYRIIYARQKFPGCQRLGLDKRSTTRV